MSPTPSSKRLYRYEHSDIEGRLKPGEPTEFSWSEVAKRSFDLIDTYGSISRCLTDLVKWAKLDGSYRITELESWWTGGKVTLLSRGQPLQEYVFNWQTELPQCILNNLEDPEEAPDTLNGVEPKSTFRLQVFDSEAQPSPSSDTDQVPSRNGALRSLDWTYDTSPGWNDNKTTYSVRDGSAHATVTCMFPYQKEATAVDSTGKKLEWPMSYIPGPWVSGERSWHLMLSEIGVIDDVTKAHSSMRPTQTEQPPSTAHKASASRKSEY